MIQLEPYLSDLENRICPQEEEQIEAAWLSFANGENPEGQPFTPPRRTPRPPKIDWPRIHINDALENEELMILSQFGICSHALSNPGCTPMHVRANYGVGNMAGLFGARPFIMPREMNTLPNVYPLEGGEEAIRRIVEGPAPSITGGHFARIYSVGEKFRKILETYPRIGRFIRMEPPDAQGPMDNCELLWGSDVFYALYDEEELVHAFLSLLTDTMIRCLDAWWDLVPRRDGHTIFFGRLCKGEAVIRDDSAMNLSPEFFDAYIAPYDGKVLAHFGGGMVHFCGKGDHFAPALGKIPCLNAVDMTQPHLNNMDIILSALPDQGINLFVPRFQGNLENHALHRAFIY